MRFPDVIGIGAINYDYMFCCQKPESTGKRADSGREDLDRSIKEVEDEITELFRSTRELPDTQVGGSALLAIKTIHAIEPRLSIAYVGVCGLLSEFDKRNGSIINIQDELSFIDNQDWMFYTDNLTPEKQRYIGKSVVRLYKHTRDHIKISSGANQLLIDLIKEKEKTDDISFANFLATAKWIHISSLQSFDDFRCIMDYVREAKRINRFLRVSVDPGFQYTDKYRGELIQYLKIADFVFLSIKEYDNLVLNPDLAENDKYSKLASCFKDSDEVRTKVLVIKHRNRHELIDLENGIPYVQIHNTISSYQIFNDTGAGDCFAGGFIAGMLSERLIAQQPCAIDLGVLAAKSRMRTPDSSNVFKNIKYDAENYFAKKYKNGRDSTKKRILFYVKTHFKSVIAFIAGILVTYLIEYILSLVI